MKIERVEVYCLQDPEVAYVHFDGSYQNALVVVYGDNGLYGIGESDSPPQLIKTLIEMRAYTHLSMGLAEIIVGETLDDPRRLWELMYRKSSWHGRYGAAIHAISAVDMALWDLHAKSAGVPLYQLLGGLQHQRLPAYAAIYAMKESWAEIEAQFAPYLRQGFQRFKIYVEPWWQDREKAIQHLYAIRDLLGPNRHLMLDVALEFTTLEELKPFLPVFADIDLKWLEAPLPLDNIAGHAALRQLTDIPIGVGDVGLTTTKEFERFLAADAFDIAQPDVSFFGGISELLKLKTVLDQHGKRVIPHAYNTEILCGFNAHFACAQRRPEPLEFTNSDSILKKDLILNPLQLDPDGMVTMDTMRSGAGLALNWELVKRCTVQ